MIGVGFPHILRISDADHEYSRERGARVPADPQRGDFVRVDLAEVFPDVPVHGEIGEHDTLLSIGKGRRILGY